MAFVVNDNGDIVSRVPIAEDSDLFSVLEVEDDREDHELSDVQVSEVFDQSSDLQDVPVFEEELTEDLIDSSVFVSAADLSEVYQVNALAAAYYDNVSTAYGTFNSQVIDLMDRIIDNYPLDYEYAAIRNNVNDAYDTTLYVGKKASASGSDIQFTGSVDRIRFARTTGTNAHLYYTVSSTSDTFVDVGSDSIVYTNVLKGYPSLGSAEVRPVTNYLLYLPFIIVALLFVVGRKR